MGKIKIVYRVVFGILAEFRQILIFFKDLKI